MPEARSQKPIAKSQEPTASRPDFAIEHGHGEYSDAELLEQAQGNVQALILGTIRFLEERGVATEEWTAFLGNLFAEGWGPLRPWDSSEFLDAALTNLRSLGARVESVDLGVERAEATVTGFPDPDLAEVLGVTPARASGYLAVVGEIAATRGLRLTWTLERDGVLRLVVVRG